MLYYNITKNIKTGVFYLFLFFTCSSLKAADAVITVAVEHWPPWEIVDRKSNKVTSGLAVDLVKELAARLGISVQLQDIPWKRAILKAKHGSIDLIPMITHNNDREKFLLFSEPIYTDQLLFMSAKEKLQDFKWDKIEDLKPYKIGVVRGYSYGVKWNQNFSNSQLNTYILSSDIQGISMLLRGRIDLLPIYKSAGLSLIKEAGQSDRLSFNKPALDQGSVFYFGISKKSFLSQKISTINETLRSMKADGTFETILKELL